MYDKNTRPSFFLLTYFSLRRHRHSPCLGAFSRISGHFVIAPPPSPSTTSSVLPRPLLLLLHLLLHRLLLLLLLLLPPPPPASTSRNDSSRYSVLLFSFLFLSLSSSFASSGPARSNNHQPPINHLIPLQYRERRRSRARRLIFGRTFRFGVLYWTVQKWHLPVSELTSCQVSVSFARAIPGRCTGMCAYTYVAVYVPRVFVYACRTADPPLSPLYTRSYLASLSRACSRSPPYERDSVARSLRLMCVCVAACIAATAADDASVRVIPACRP